MLRRALTILSLIGLLLSVGLWAGNELQRGIPWRWYFSGSPLVMTRPPQTWIVISALLFGSTFCLCRPLHHRRRRKRKKLGLCLKCGYDLRASKDRCPECGAGFSKLGTVTVFWLEQ